MAANNLNLLNTPLPTEMVHRGIECDSQGEIGNALSWYNSALEAYNRYIRWENDEDTRKLIQSKLSSLKDRIEVLSLEVTTCSKIDDAPQSGQTSNGTVQWVQCAPCEENSFDVVRIPAALKSKLDNMVYLPMKFPKLFAEKKRTWQALLFYGPAGCGKSCIAKTLANESNSHLKVLDCRPVPLAKWRANSTNSISEIFKQAHDSGHCTFILIENIDALNQQHATHPPSRGPNIEDIETDILTEMKSIPREHSKVLVIATAREPWNITPSLLRRFDKQLFFGPPDYEDREHLIDSFMHEQLGFEEVERVALLTRDFSVRQIRNLFRDAVRVPFHRVQAATKFVQHGDGSIVPFRESNNLGIEENTCEENIIVATSVLDVPSTKCKVDEVSFDDVMKVLKYLNPDTRVGKLRKYIDWKTKDD